jgi:hypothetical protein
MNAVRKTITLISLINAKGPKNKNGLPVPSWENKNKNNFKQTFLNIPTLR